MRRLFGLLGAAVLIVGCGQAPPATQAAPAPVAEPHANLAQLMRGIPFTFSNIIFDAQSADPGKPIASADISAGATAAYASVYGGWQQVENSALALAETANLLLIPGRLCENGKPVPIDREDFRQAADGLKVAGMAAYKAAQSRDLDAMVDVAGTVSDSCAQCHEPYRDFDDPKDRCGGASAQAE
jgi:hypothetical protein